MSETVVKAVQHCAKSESGRPIINAILLWRFIGAALCDQLWQIIGWEVNVARTDPWPVIFLACVFYGFSPEVAALIKAIKGVQ